jgi:hypothetical protein
MINRLQEIANQPVPVQDTSFSLDNMGRYLCNTLEEALVSTGHTVAGKQRAFDAVVIGGGSFGSVVANGCSCGIRRAAAASSCSSRAPSSSPSMCRTFHSWAANPISECLESSDRDLTWAMRACSMR